MYKFIVTQTSKIQCFKHYTLKNKYKFELHFAGYLCADYRHFKKIKNMPYLERVKIRRFRNYYTELYQKTFIVTYRFGFR